MPALALRHPHRLLHAQDLVVGAVVERDLFSAALLGRSGLLAHPQQASADDVEGQERHVSCTEPLAQIASHGIERTHRHGILHRCQHLGQCDPIAWHISLLSVENSLSR
ncbi:hypothetical protein GCM10011578_001320 [Streptomyces fuscichromogenes]|uniref:Uncharacterized protein n=1 Tax=Streptomyces fuscichromogenes TaxID=1324013 RepID=A0A917UDX1_9ACTN|nr:hypothetical protein GCM10011578_001320 [Streptomyces fuscichromogenes]